MLVHSLLDSADGSRCVLTFEEDDQWMQATWQGYIDPVEAMLGAQNYLQCVESWRCSYLLNDNTALRGPWFNSVEWLQEAWLPHAVRLGLRYVAHVVQCDTHTDILTLTLAVPLLGALEIQLFHSLPEAKEWLRACQTAEAAHH